MAIKRMDHVTIVVEDLERAVAFFKVLGLELEGQMAVEGEWVDRICGLKNTKADIAMMHTPDGHSRIELTKYRNPVSHIPEKKLTEPNTVGLRQLMFAVDDVDDVVATLTKHGSSLIGEIVNYQDVYRLCYMRGPEGLIIALAEELK